MKGIRRNAIGSCLFLLMFLQGAANASVSLTQEVSPIEWSRFEDRPSLANSFLALWLDSHDAIPYHSLPGEHR